MLNRIPKKISSFEENMVRLNPKHIKITKRNQRIYPGFCEKNLKRFILILFVR
jgi:hypothetical protein